MSRSIRQHIAQHTLLRLGIFLLLGIVGAFLLTKAIIDQQISNEQNVHIEKFFSNYSLKINSIKKEVRNIANNDLIINSLIDPDEAKHYLPLFIRSFKFSGIDKSYIKVTDFNGEKITENIPLKKELNNEWKSIVLDDGKQYHKISPKGFFTAAPIHLSDRPEGEADGAVISFIEFKEIKKLFNFSGKHLIIIADKNNNIIYSSHTQLIKEGFNLRQADLTKWILEKRPYAEGSLLDEPVNLILGEPKSEIYPRIVPLIIFGIIAVILAITLVISSIFLSSSIITRTLNHFFESLKISSKSQAINKNFDLSPYTEVAHIEKEFYKLLNDLLTTKALKDNVDSLLNSLSEYLVVFDEKGAVQIKNNAFTDFISNLETGSATDFDKVIPRKLRQSALDSRAIVPDFEKQYFIKTPNSTQEINGHSKSIVRWSRSLFYDQKGEVKGVIFIGSDITSSRKTEEELYIKNQAIDEASNGVVIADIQKEDMPLVYVNHHFLIMTGYDYNEVINKNCRFLQGEKTAKDSIFRIKEAVKKGERINETLLNYKKDGTEFYNHLTLTPIHNKEGVVTHYLGLQFDATEKVRAEIELLQAKEKAEESSKIKSEFLASMSHEIRTPMNGVLGMLGLIKKTELNDKQQHYVNLAKNSAQSLLTIINDILDFSKIESGKLELELIQFSLPSILSEVTETLAYKAQEKGLEIVLDISEINHHLFSGDPGRLRQVLTNLIGNAIKFTHEGHIIVKASLRPTANTESLYLDCQVIDSGIGIPPEKMDSLFDAFSQVDASTTREYGGTGLGLSIAQNLCELMGGNISVASNLDGGSCFEFHIQLQPVKKDEVKSSNCHLNHLNILIVDSQDHSRSTLKKQLEKWQARITVSASGADVQQRLSSEWIRPFDAIIIDRTLMDTQADQLLKTIKGSPLFERTHFILAMPTYKKASQDTLQSMGFDTGILKPYTHNQLQILIKSLGRPTLASEIRIKVPQSQSADDHLLEKEAPDKAPSKNLSLKASSNKILLVEDNPVNQQVALGILEAYGFELDIANHGKEALDMLSHSDAYNLVLMDCQMPIMDGYEATKAIRELTDNRRHIPVIAMTANAMKGDREKCLAAGMNDYISKPIDPEILKATINQWQNHKPTQPSLQETKPMTDSSNDDPLWDQEGFMQRIMNNETIAEKLIQLFKTDTGKSLSELEQIIEERNTKEAGLLAHKIKGSASNLGGIKLAGLLQQMESAGHDDDMEKLLELWPLIKPQYNALLDCIDKR